LRDTPTLLLEGPRSVGKSTILRQLAVHFGGRILDLDDLATLDAVRADVARAVAGSQMVLIDEYQKAPEVLEAMKAELNRATYPGRFVLTGSTRHDALPGAAQALTGRLETLKVFPLSQGERDDRHEDFLALALEHPEEVLQPERSQTSREEYVARITAGGFPLALTMSSEAARRRWVRHYVRLTLERDIRELSNLRQGDKLGLLLGRLAGQTAQVLNVASAATDVGLTPVTAESYISLLERVFLVHRLEAWGTTLLSRSVAKPKIHVLDSAVAATLLRITPEKLLSLRAAASTEFGHVVESFAVGELQKQASWNEAVTGVGHWRHLDGYEVDFVVEREDGGVIGFEMKTSARIQGSDMKGMSRLRDALGAQFVGGFALYLGERSYTFADRLHVVPLDRLWTPMPH
jgi:predicted AAA+ superfamily ATPase